MDSARWAFLVTGASDQEASDRLEALAPALRRLGTWKVIDRPESRLIHAATVAKSQGLSPIHLALGLPQATFLTPAVPTILAPVWDYPDVPSRSFQFDVRQNWTRLARLAAYLIAPTATQARVFIRAELGCPVAHVPTPAREIDFELPAWNPDHKYTLHCRHVILGATPTLKSGTKARSTWVPPVLGEILPPTLKRRAWNQIRHAFHAISPYYGDDARIRNMKIRKNALRLIGRNPTLAKLPRHEASIVGTARHFGKLGFNRMLRPVLSEHALGKIAGVKGRVKRLLGRPVPQVVVPEIPRSDLHLTGLVYTTIANPSDPKANPRDLITSFFMAFGSRADVTLVLLFSTPEERGFELTHHMTSFAASLGIQPKCRIAVICEPLNDQQKSELLQATTFVVTAALAQAEPTFLRRALAGGRLAVGPDHGGLGELLDTRNAFIVESHSEPTFWPHDPERKHETSWSRPVWSELKIAFQQSASLAETTPLAYGELAKSAREKVAKVASVDACVAALEHVLQSIPIAQEPRFAWAG